MMLLPADLLGLDLDNFGEWLLGAASILGRGAALLVLGGAIWAWYRRTLGRRRDRYARLARLGTGAQLSFFTSVLGEPPAMRKSFLAPVPRWDEEAQLMLPVEGAIIECFFIDRDYYIQAVCDPDESVVAFSVTTRSKRFAPTFLFPPMRGFLARRRFKKKSGQAFEHYFKVKLGHTRFADLPSGSSPKRKAESGARTYSYTEAYWYGNPGNYQHYCFTASSATYQARVGPIGDVVEEIGRDWIGGPGEEPSEPDPQSALYRFRRETPITTYTVIGPGLNPETYPAGFGPHTATM
jgi:hypothetical protein